MDTAAHPELIAERYRRGERLDALQPGATVYRAHDEILDRDVLVVLPDVPQPAAALDGARRAVLVTDPRLVKVLDVGDDSGAIPYIITEAPRGTSVATLAATAPLEGPAARALVGELSDAIEIGSSRGVHHGGLSGNNVFVTDEGVLLFGLGFAGLLGTPAAGGGAREESEAPSDAVDTGGIAHVLYLAVTGEQPSDPVIAATSIRAQVPADLDALLTGALITRNGARHPNELMHAVTPWQVSDLTALAPRDPGSGTPGGGAAAGEPAVSGDDAAPAGSDTGPRPLNRTSVRSTTAKLAAPLSTPGTPTPAPRVQRWNTTTGTGLAGAAGGLAAGGIAAGAAAGAGAAADGVPPPSFPPVTARPGSAGAAGPAPAGAATQQSAGSTGPTKAAPHATSKAVAADLRNVRDRTHRYRFNPTAIVLLVTVAGLGWAGVWAYSTFLSGLGPLITTSAVGPQPITTAPPTGDDEPGDSTPTPDEAVDPPVIASAVQVDPDGDDNEHPEAVDRAFDGDLQTSWFTRTYRSPDFGGIAKRGIGYVITLEKATLVSKVYLTTDNTGGKIEIRDSSAADPAGGTLLASGPFDGDFVMTLDTPVVTDHLVLWITKLPENKDGEFIVRLAEVSLS